MKILLVNGSPKRYGNTFLALSEIEKELKAQGAQAEWLWIGTKPVQGCIACRKCKQLGHCIFQDELTIEAQDKIDRGDGIVIGSPVYFAGPNASLCALLDRLFYSYSNHLAYKPAASVAVCRRGGATATFDRLNKYFTVTNMPVVSSQYWNLVHGRMPGEVVGDLEGMQTMRTLARNMVWMVNGLNTQPPPEGEAPIATNFIR